MHIEVSVALNFVISYLYNKLPRRRVNIFGEELEKALKDKFQGHWYPEKPFKVRIHIPFTLFFRFVFNHHTVVYPAICCAYWFRKCAKKTIWSRFYYIRILNLLRNKWRLVQCRCHCKNHHKFIYFRAHTLIKFIHVQNVPGTTKTLTFWSGCFGCDPNAMRWDTMSGRKRGREQETEKKREEERKR